MDEMETPALVRRRGAVWTRKLLEFIDPTCTDLFGKRKKPEDDHDECLFSWVAASWPNPQPQHDLEDV